MADSHRFAMLSGRRALELWNVTLLPVVPRQETKLLENLDERRSDQKVVTISPSFESQRKAAGW